jgi:serine/threonine-protein kinase
VVLARDRHLGRLVALKFLHHDGPSSLEQLRREARRLVRLAHPAIVRVHEFDVHAGRAYLAMDYVDGGNLAQQELEPRALVRALRPVVDALEHAHRLGVVHRDVKPENVLLDRRARAYLCDFGFALEDGDGRAAARAAGTPLSMSPEQAGGGAVGPASDVFSLGVTLYRQLTREWPFRGRTVADVVHAIQNEEPRRPRALQPLVPRALERIVLRCLEKQPERRFRSAAELGQALEHFLERRSPIERLSARLTRGRRRRSRPGPLVHPEDPS